MLNNHSIQLSNMTKYVSYNNLKIFKKMNNTVVIITKVVVQDHKINKETIESHK